MLSDNGKRLAKGSAKSKTIRFAVVLAILGAAQVYLPALEDIITPKEYGYATFIVAILVAGLRVATTKPLSDRD
jgi:hypothetical protein